MPTTTINQLISSINAMNIPDLRIEWDYAGDNIVLTNTKRAQRTVVGRIEIENSNSPYSVIASAIETVMPNTTPVTAVNTGAIGASSGGGAGFGSVIKSAMQKHSIIGYNPNGTIMHDMPELEAELEEKEKQLQRDLVRNRLFTEAERYELSEVKHKVVTMFKNRLAEEMSIPFKLNKMIIAGGCFTSLINNEPINDIDVFLLDDEYNRDLAQGVAKSYESDQPVVVLPQAFSANTANGMGLDGYISLSPKKNNNHVRIGNSNYMDNDKIEQTIFFKHSKMQYITTKYKTREELINHFDFKHCCVSYDFATEKLYITREVYDLIKSKKLVQNSDRIPATWRFEKFRERGWKHEPLDVMFL
jgi:hypothetical protein